MKIAAYNYKSKIWHSIAVNVVQMTMFTAGNGNRTVYTIHLVLDHHTH